MLQYSPPSDALGHGQAAPGRGPRTAVIPCALIGNVQEPAARANGLPRSSTSAVSACDAPLIMSLSVVAHAGRLHRVLHWFIATDRRPFDAARTMISVGHVLVGGAALVVSGVLIVEGRAPYAELGAVSLGLGLLLAFSATAFTWTAVLVLRRAHGGRGSPLSLSLIIVELVAGAAVAVALALAVEGYGAFQPWRSPLLLPSALLRANGLAGLALEVMTRRRPNSYARVPACAHRHAGVTAGRRRASVVGR